MNTLLASIAQKKQQLDMLRPSAAGALRQLQKDYDIELTFTSNAIEGNALTARETAEVIEHGITAGGKRLNDHLEAVDHYDAVLRMRQLASQATPIGETDIRDLHRRIVGRSEPGIAGIYSPLRMRGPEIDSMFPDPSDLSALMVAFGRQVEQCEATPAAAFDVHFRLTSIHPFSRGNGRTARLLMNLMLLRNGYVPVAVRPEDRRVYLDTLEHGSLTADLGPFQTFMHRRLDDTLTEYLDALEDPMRQQDY